MPWSSMAQARWGHTAEGAKALGGKANVREWDAATDFGSLPKKKGGNVKNKIAGYLKRAAAARLRGAKKNAKADRKAMSATKRGCAR